MKYETVEQLAAAKEVIEDLVQGWYVELSKNSRDSMGSADLKRLSTDLLGMLIQEVEED